MKTYVKVILVILLAAGLLFFVKKYFSGIEHAEKACPPVRQKARIALVLDDWGYNLKNVKLLNKIKQPITLSILPHLPYSKRIALSSAKEGRREVIVHLPLESYEHKNMEQDTICRGMDDNQIKKIFNSAVLSVPGARGVSNHMGSKVTEDKNVMAVIFGLMKEEGFFFLDSLVTTKSVCEEVASKAKIKFAQRDVFLDNVNDEACIEQQFEELVETAKANGVAVGIGHDRELTLKVLNEVMESSAHDGIEFVYLSEVVR
ncbi:MAG: divergent polysaccharide deacetylase family protein [Candidatus Omnitrophota bacterium]